MLTPLAPLDVCPDQSPHQIALTIHRLILIDNSTVDTVCTVRLTSQDGPCRTGPSWSGISEGFQDSDAAAHIAGLAGARLLEIRAKGGPAEVLKAAGDEGSHELILEALGRLYPDDAVLSEEGADDAARLGRPRVWIVDPLDGTREFSEPRRPDWAVHVALVVDGFLTVGAVALPARRLTLSTPGRSITSFPRRPISDGPPRLTARLSARRLAAGLQPAQPVVARPTDLPTRPGGDRHRDCSSIS